MNRLDVEAVDYVLTTTRVVRKRLDFDRTVPREIVESAIRVAVQAPTADNHPRWHWYVIDDGDIKVELQEALEDLLHGPAQGLKAWQEMVESQSLSSAKTVRAVISGTESVSKNFHRVPVFVIPTIENPVPLEEVSYSEMNGPAVLYGSILPAAWSLHLALRARGLVSAWGGWGLSAPGGVSLLRRLTNMAPNHHPVGYMFPVAYPLGGTDFPSAGRSIDGVVHWNGAGPRQGQ
ncbi:Nitroreductase family protein [Mycobacteroides salmoniphilum]|uniref:Nitroreductase family protein n=1 Tax=Mycobacteroides salmoniphilum TaxID=404941 RepID=A0A4R8STD3_9MYCO|nr:Nitroreductase family protein [Mycobacteroides salmoniphilum]